MTENMSIAAVVATIVSLLLEWFPGLNTWWDGFTEAQKRGIMAAIVAGVSIAVVAGNCYGRGQSCPADWVAFLQEVLMAFLAAATVNQGIHLLSKRPAQTG